MNLTDYHAKYFAHELTKRCPSDSIEKLANAVAGAQLDLNPQGRKLSTTTWTTQFTTTRTNLTARKHDDDR